jgi:NADPH:quinone reductase-like Zn-dependent oxidoreductase
MPQAKSLTLNTFGLDGLTLKQTDVAAPGPYEVLVDLHFASLNYRDLMTVLGQYNPKPELPRVPGSDAAGIVTAVGSAVTRFRPSAAPSTASSPPRASFPRLA